jgi:hypothetical protein
MTLFQQTYIRNWFGMLMSGIVLGLPTIALTEVVAAAQTCHPCPSGNASPTPPLPEAVQDTIAVVTPVAGTVDIRLRNDTSTSITYQVIGNTEQRVLGGGQEVLLQNLPVPVTLTLVRPDGGFVRVTPLASEEAGLLSLALSGTDDLGENVRSLSIQPTGQVLAY